MLMDEGHLIFYVLGVIMRLCNCFFVGDPDKIWCKMYWGGKTWQVLKTVNLH